MSTHVHRTQLVFSIFKALLGASDSIALENACFQLLRNIRCPFFYQNLQRPPAYYLPLFYSCVLGSRLFGAIDKYV